MTEVKLGLSLSQMDPALHPGIHDIDDCWAIAGMQAARAVGASLTGVDIPKYRKAAGRPDDPHKTNPGGAADVLRGAHNLWPKLRISLSSTSFDTLWAALVKQGKVAVFLIDSSKLPEDIRYGFNGLHAICGRVVVTTSAETCYEVNPLQPKSTRAHKISKAALKRTLEGYPNAVQAILFAPAPPPPPKPVPPGGPTPTPPIVDPTPYDQADLDEAHEKGRVDGLQAAIEAIETLI